MTVKFLCKTAFAFCAFCLLGASLPAFASITDLKGSHSIKMNQTAPKREVLTLAPGCGQGGTELLMARPGSGRCNLQTRRNSASSNSNLGLKTGHRNSQTAHHEGTFSARHRGPSLVQDSNAS